MSTAAERARAKADRLATKHPQHEPELVTGDEPQAAEPSRPASVPRAARVKPVQMSLHLAPVLYAEFDDWTTHTTRQLGRGRIARADVLRILVRQLLADAALQSRVVEELQAEGRNR